MVGLPLQRASWFHPVIIAHTYTQAHALTQVGPGQTRPATIFDIFASTSKFVFVMEGQRIYLEMMSAMREPSHFPRSLYSATPIILIVYAFVSIASYAKVMVMAEIAVLMVMVLARAIWGKGEDNGGGGDGDDVCYMREPSHFPRSLYSNTPTILIVYAFVYIASYAKVMVMAVVTVMVVLIGESVVTMVMVRARVVVRGWRMKDDIVTQEAVGMLH